MHREQNEYMLQQGLGEHKVKSDLVMVVRMTKAPIASGVVGGPLVAHRWQPPLLVSH